MEEDGNFLLVLGAGQAGISSVPAFYPFGHNSWCGNYDFGVILSPLGARVFVVQMAICGTKTHLASIKSGCFIASLYPSISRLINFSRSRDLDISRCNPCDSLSDLPLIVSLVIGPDSSLTLSIRIALGLGISAPESSVSSFLFLTHHPSSTHTIPQAYAVMGGGAISFSFHRRCGIYVLLIHSDIFFIRPTIGVC